MARATLKAVWTDTNADETITYVQVSTDSKSMRPDEIDPTTKRAWMNIGSVAADAEEFSFELELPFTVVRTRIRAAKVGTVPTAWEPLDGHLLSVTVDGPAINPVAGVSLQITAAPDEGGTILFPPSSVTDLAAVAGSATDELDITFTAVSDGAGGAAKYRIRYLQGTSPALVWGTATPATGSCLTATPPVSIGDPMACTLTGLLPNVSYQVQLESYRGTIDTDAVFGGLSNIATGVTDAGVVPDPLLAPTGLTPTGNTSEGLKTFSWNTVADATQYQVRIHIVGQPYDPPTVPTNYLAFDDQVGTSVQVTVVAGKSYDWWIAGMRNGIPGPLAGGLLAVQGAGVTNPTPVSLLPAPTTVNLGSSRLLTVTLTGAYDQSVVVNTSSSNSSIVTVPSIVTIPVGQVTGTFNANGVALGTATVSAVYNGVTRQSSVQVLPVSAPTGWPNQPAHLSTYVDYNFTPPWPSYMFDVFGNAPGSLTTITLPGQQPASPSGILDYFMAAGASTGGGAQGYDFTFNPPFRTVREVYLGTWWATNADFEGSKVTSNKLFFISGNNNNNVMCWLGNAGTTVGRRIGWINQNKENNCHVTGWVGGCGDNVNFVSGEFQANVNSSAAIVFPGSGWHLIETYQKSSTTATSQDGIIKWWVDGNLIGNYTNLNHASQGFHSIQYNATWDGQQALQCGGHPTLFRDCSKSWHHYWDHLRLAAV